MTRDSSLEIISSSAESTEALGYCLAELLPSGSVVALSGDLATGKTCLVRGMAACYAPECSTHSPTFTLVNEYGRAPVLYHLDLYRLTSPEELADIGYEELFDPDGVCVVEWAERADGFLPEEALHIDLAHAGADRRRLCIHTNSVLPSGWQEKLRAILA